MDAQTLISNGPVPVRQVNAAPLFEIRQPAEDPVGDENNVEALRQLVPQGINIRFDESRFDSNLLGQ
jgi:hypothetical protein